MSKTGDYDHLSSQGAAPGSMGIVRTVELETFVEQKRHSTVNQTRRQGTSRISDELASIDGQGSSSRSVSIRGVESESETPIRHAV